MGAMRRQTLALTGEVKAPPTLAGWVVDDSYHVVITETGVPGASGELRYPSNYPGSVQFPSSVAPGEAWEGWIDGVNIGDAAGEFRFYMSSTSACTGDIGMTDPTTLNPSAYEALQVTGTGPADFYICLMRYVS